MKAYNCVIICITGTQVPQPQYECRLLLITQYQDACNYKDLYGNHDK